VEDAVTEKLDSHGRRVNWSDERRRAAAERMRALWADPEFCAKRAEASRKAIEDKWTNRREEALTQMRYNLQCSPKRSAYAHTRLQDPQRMSRHQKLLAHLNSDPAIKEKRIAALRRKFADPAYRQTLKRAQDKRRGFRVPAHKKAEYDFLRITKKLNAREAGQMLGLI
jgi:hypothetical protein